jgi:hypothetical protein
MEFRRSMEHRPAGFWRSRGCFIELGIAMDALTVVSLLPTIFLGGQKLGTAVFGALPTLPRNFSFLCCSSSFRVIAAGYP